MRSLAVVFFVWGVLLFAIAAGLDLLDDPKPVPVSDCGGGSPQLYQQPQ